MHLFFIFVIFTDVYQWADASEKMMIRVCLFFPMETWLRLLVWLSYHCSLYKVIRLLIISFLGSACIGWLTGVVFLLF